MHTHFFYSTSMVGLFRDTYNTMILPNRSARDYFGPRSNSRSETRVTETPKDQAPSTSSATFQSWLFGILNGGRDSWFMRYIDYDFVEVACDWIKSFTGEFDVRTAVTVFMFLNAGRVYGPGILGFFASQFKLRFTSCQVISAIDAPLYAGILQLAREKSEQNVSLWNGRRNVRMLDGQLRPLPSDAESVFWHNGTRFTIERHSAKNNDKHPASGIQTDDFMPHRINAISQLTVRCFGYSDDPIEKLIEHVNKRVVQGQKLNMIEMQAGAPDKSQQRNKLPRSMMDLDPNMIDDIIADVELFFREDSQNWYENTGMPYRRGYLLCGPPGTGKTSLSTALASHCNVSLVIISLRGMDDNQLKEAFSRVPFKSIVLLEDIDCAGANVGNRGAQAARRRSQAASSFVGSNIPEGPRLSVLESMMNRFIEEQNVFKHELLSRVTAMEGRVTECMGEEADEDYVPRTRDNGRESSNTPNATSSSVSLSGLLNVIDGANAKEGRLLIMTTNHPEKLDPSLYRAGRIERKFEIGYANKQSALRTFKRLFDNDVLKRYTTDAIDRSAKAFQDQFPSRSKVTTAELSKYCGQYRGRPDKAVEEFADWLKVGADKFTCPMDYTQSNDEDGEYNIPEPFDRALLQVGPSDLVDRTAIAARTVAPEVHDSRSMWDMLCWDQGNVGADFVQLREELLVTSGECVDQEEQASLFDGFTQAQAAHGELTSVTECTPRPVGLGVASLPGFFHRHVTAPHRLAHVLGTFKGLL